MKNFKLFFIFIFISSFLFTGCLGVNHKFEKIRNSIFAKLGENLPSKAEFAIGSVGIYAAGLLAKLDPDNNNVAKMIRHIDNLQVGVYQYYSHFNSNFDLDYFKSLDRKMAENGYKLIVCSIEGSEATGIYVEDSNDDILHKMFIINYDNGELILTEIKGNLNEVLAEAIKNKKMDVNI